MEPTFLSRSGCGLGLGSRIILKISLSLLATFDLCLSRQQSCTMSGTGEDDARTS